MPPNARAIEEAALGAYRFAAPRVANEARAGLRLFGTKAASGAKAIGKLAVSKPVRTAAGVLTVGAGIGAGVLLAGKGAEGAVQSVRQGFAAPTGESTIDVLSRGFTPQDAQQSAAAAEAQTPSPAAFLTSWKGLLVIGIVGAIVLVYLMKRGK